MKYHVIRLTPGEDLFLSLENYLQKKNIEAGCILSVVGSLRYATLRLANQGVPSSFSEKFEIVSLSGTVSIHGSHLHIAISDKNGKTLGGHLLKGCEVFTTVELVIGHMPDLIFTREECPLSGYPELVVKTSSSQS